MGNDQLPAAPSCRGTARTRCGRRHHGAVIVTDAITGVFREAGCDGYLHAVDLAAPTGGSIEHGADEPVVTASVFKIAVLLEVCRRFATGELDPVHRVRVTPEERCLGPTGLSVMCDDVVLSVRDLAYLMMSVSDNTATDVLMRLTGLDAINEGLARLDLAHTTLVGDCAYLLADMPDTPDNLPQWEALDPQRTNRSTPRDITRLLELIWTDRAAAADACAEVRRIMALQVWPHRLTSGFPAGVTLAAKTGTLPGIRNEAGVVTYPDGGQYAVAVFTRAFDIHQDRQPAIDSSIGRSAFLAVEALRASAGR